MSGTATIVRSSGKRIALVVNLVIHSLYVLSLPAWYFLSMFSVMLFDSPGSETYLPVVLFYYALQSYPYVAAAAIVAAWIMYKKGLYRWTYLVTSIPVLIMIISTGLMIIFGE